MVCPEGDVLAMLGWQSGHRQRPQMHRTQPVREACPVGAITMVMATPSMGADMPYMTAEYETSVENLFIIGELGGLALIKNAVNQGRDCIDYIMRRPRGSLGPAHPDLYDGIDRGRGTGRDQRISTRH